MGVYPVRPLLKIQDSGSAIQDFAEDAAIPAGNNAVGILYYLRVGLYRSIQMRFLWGYHDVRRRSKFRAQNPDTKEMPKQGRSAAFSALSPVGWHARGSWTGFWCYALGWTVL